MSGGNESSDPWGMREEPEDIQGLGNMEIRQQQQHILRGKWTGPKVTKLCSCSTQLSMKFEPRCEKTGLRGFRPGHTKNGLYCRRR